MRDGGALGYVERQQPKRPLRWSRQLALLGPIGAGKTTAINVVAIANVAEPSDDAVAVVRQFAGG